MLGGSKATPVLHTSASWGCPLFPDNSNRHPCASKATGAWDGAPAGHDAPVHPCINREGSLLSGAEKPTAPQPLPRLGFQHPPLLRTTHPHTSPEALSLSPGRCSSLSCFRAPSGVSRAGVLPADRRAPSPPPTAGLFWDVCLSQRTPRAEEGGEQWGWPAGSPAASQDPGASQQPARVPCPSPPCQAGGGHLWHVHVRSHAHAAPDAALLAGVPEDILCFSRSFEDLTCFWDEEEEEAASGMCHFYYWYSRDAPTACAVSTWRRAAGGMRHVCVFPSQDVRLFTQLHLCVLDAITNQAKYQRKLSVDAVGLIAPPGNITARWAGAAGQLCVSWQPPLGDYLNFFLYEVQCCPASSPEMPCSTMLDPGGQQPGDPSSQPAISTHAPTAGGATASLGAGQRLVQANTWVVLRDLRPGVRYHIQVRSKPDGTSMDGVWGPWSQAVAAETPRSSGDIGLSCSTPDLQHVRCEWSWDPAEPHGSHQLFYRPPPSRASTREDAWQRCEEVSVGVQGTHACTFQPRAGSAISILVNVTQPHALPTLSYFKEPFWLHQAGESQRHRGPCPCPCLPGGGRSVLCPVPCNTSPSPTVLTDAPQLVQATVSQGQLSLQWLPPLEVLAEQLDYQVRYAVEKSHDWKVLQVPRAARKEVLDLRPGARYHAQVRAQPSGPWYQGSWSAWSKPVVVDAMASAGWIIPSVTVVPLLFTGVLLGLRCTFPSLYSNVKQKLWPPVPDLHRTLGSFLHESSKHGQANTFYKQPPEEAVLPCLLEVLPGPRGEPGAPPPPPPEHAAGRLPGTDIANQSYLLMSGWEPRGPP
ncbi:thrombopoietin receptor isoform X3 [Aquila chrysaetos chrysaetos]|uniref:thrombopoietin receptor isoform X3 n=1 Tax=Aquila chrysaetos chrysaetos TaxID=223781 RepID=UPI001B7D323E|nr:thrombopoietin receptor isoform X3 [Aquila chrysaetos chrysaetos]